MATINKKEHWDSIYSAKKLEEVSWYQLVPTTSLQLFSNNTIDKNARIIDIGGGDSLLVDHLLELGFKNISVLDISANAIQRAKTRLGQKAKSVNWIIADITEYIPVEKYDVWHDRAAFHFITNENDILQYTQKVYDTLVENGLLFIGTFSKNGPKKCSGIEIKQYDTIDLAETFGHKLKLVESFNTDHLTPSQQTQHFSFCTFIKN